MKRSLLASAAAFAVSQAAVAGVILHTQPDALYTAFIPGNYLTVEVRAKRTTGDVYCSGSAIAKNIIITAAHCVSEWSGSSAPVAVPTSRVGFQGVDGTWYMPHHVYLDPGWNAFYGDDDILSLYRENDEVGKEVLLSGPGRTGTGLTGEILGGGTIRAGTNVIESADASTLYVDFDPPSGTPAWAGRRTSIQAPLWRSFLRTGIVGARGSSVTGWPASRRSEMDPDSTGRCTQPRASRRNWTGSTLFWPRRPSLPHIASRIGRYAC
jgi:hypothetical protein